jgi:hypothetical protein
LQGWGDHTDLSQAVVMYIFAAASVCVYCWISSELSEQVEELFSQIRAEFTFLDIVIKANTLSVLQHVI